MDMDFGALMAMAVFNAEEENAIKEAKKVMSFIKLNCLNEGFIIKTPLSNKTRVAHILHYIADHIDEFD